MKARYVIKPTCHAQKKAMDFRTYRLLYHDSRVSSYEKSRKKSRKKKSKVEMESHILNPADPISRLEFLLTLKRSFNKISMHERVAMFPFAQFMTVSAKKDLLHRLYGEDNDDDNNDDDSEQCSWMMHFYDEVINYLLATLAYESKIYQTDAAIDALL